MAEVILVDEENREIGTMEKMEAHEKGLLHRAFSIFVFNDQNELLLQQRNKNKYHSGGLWSNTVCSHPIPGEEYEEAIHRRLKEEMGFDCPLKKVDCIIYKAEFENGLTEHEYDCVFRGQYEGEISPDPEEVEDCKWLSLSDLRADMVAYPSKYTEWFKKILMEDKLF